jgi:hypothetical protein
VQRTDQSACAPLFGAKLQLCAASEAGDHSPVHIRYRKAADDEVAAMTCSGRGVCRPAAAPGQQGFCRQSDRAAGRGWGRRHSGAPCAEMGCHHLNSALGAVRLCMPRTYHTCGRRLVNVRMCINSGITTTSGCSLLRQVHADLHRDGLLFPHVLYDHQVRMVFRHLRSSSSRSGTAWQACMQHCRLMHTAGRSMATAGPLLCVAHADYHAG